MESEAKEPFYVLIDGKTNYSSSLNGFLTIPQMIAGDYDAEVGFVKDKYPSQHFIISIKGMDVGFILRRAKDNTFGLLNLQTFATIAPAAIENSTPTQTQQAMAEAMAKIPETTAKTMSPFANKLKQNPNCIIATDADFNALKKLMQAAKTETQIIAEGKAVFAEKCFSTEQIRKLSKVIITEKSKLSLFLVAKECIYDGNNYASLQNQLTEPAILKQFRNCL